MSAAAFWGTMKTVTTNAFLAGLLLAAAISCSSPERDAFTRLAREINPILTAMQPAAKRMLAADPADHDEIIAACWSVDDPLRMLRDIDFDQDHIRPSPKFFWPADYPKMLFEMRPYACNPALHDLCSELCLEKWTSMIEAVERLRVAAKSEGVEIVSLDPR